MKQCQAKSYCNKYGTKECNSYCGLYSLLQAIYSLSNLPKKYQYSKTLATPKVDMEAYKELMKFQKSIVKQVEQGKGVYIWSKNTGNGKTTWATNIANYYIRKSVKTKRIEGLVLYINVPTYLERIRRSFNKDDNRLEEINNQILESDLVIFDDIGTERPSEWVQEQLYRIINHRDNELKSSIYTSNVSPLELKENLGQRIHSRVVANKVIEFRGGDIRCMSNKL